MSHELLYLTLDVRQLIEAWRREGNKERPHSTLRNLTPKQFAEGLLRWTPVRGRTKLGAGQLRLDRAQAVSGRGSGSLHAQHISDQVLDYPYPELTCMAVCRIRDASFPLARGSTSRKSQSAGMIKLRLNFLVLRALLPSFDALVWPRAAMIALRAKNQPLTVRRFTMPESRTQAFFLFN